VIAAGESISSGEAREPQSRPLRWQHACISSSTVECEVRWRTNRRASPPSAWRQLMRNVIFQETSVPDPGSPRPGSVRQPFMLWWPSAAVTIRPTTSSRKAPVAILLKPLESQVTPELLSPIYSRLVPARSGCVRRSPVSERQWHHSLEGSINLVARRSARPHQRSRLNRTLSEPAAL
jgi:hypothetical protein